MKRLSLPVASQKRKALVLTTGFEDGIVALLPRLRRFAAGLSRNLADKRIFPAVDVNASGTRREEILLSPDELKIVYKLRRVMGALDQQQAIELLLGQLKKTQTNVEFLLHVQKTTPGGLADDENVGRTI